MSKATLDLTEFNAAINKLEKVSTYADYDLVTSNGRTLLKSLVFNTPRKTGKGRAGWWPAWTLLNMRGTPGTRRKLGAEKIKKRIYISEGYVIDERRKVGEASITFKNKTHVKTTKKGKKIDFYYLGYWNNRKNWIQKAYNEATWKFGKQYERILRRASAR